MSLRFICWLVLGFLESSRIRFLNVRLQTCRILFHLNFLYVSQWRSVSHTLAAAVCQPIPFPSVWGVSAAFKERSFSKVTQLLPQWESHPNMRIYSAASGWFMCLHPSPGPAPTAVTSAESVAASISPPKINSSCFSWSVSAGGQNQLVTLETLKSKARRLIFAWSVCLKSEHLLFLEKTKASHLIPQAARVSASGTDYWLPINVWDGK